MTVARVMLDRLSGQLDALLGVFEPEGLAAAESLSERLEASRGRLEAFVKGAAVDAVQHTLGLVKSHYPEVDLNLVDDGIPPECSGVDWEANHASIQDIAKRIVADLLVVTPRICFLFILLQNRLVSVGHFGTMVM